MYLWWFKKANCLATSEKRSKPKPVIYACCGFKVINSKKIKLHHTDQTNIGSKNKRIQKYFSSNLKPLCANYHSLKYRNEQNLIKICDQ